MSSINQYFTDQQDLWNSWRHHLHQHPETAFEEIDTSAFIAEKLKSFGIEVATGYGITGVVGRIKNGEGPRIGLRADMDALNIVEENQFSHKSEVHGKMHACGHDGHTVMLLAAAKYLAETRPFTGEIITIFQPAEENEGGAREMIVDGLFDDFPLDEIYAIHNWPGLAAGQLAVLDGPQMAAFDLFDITITGQGSHAAMPHEGRDPILAAAHLVTTLQSVCSRSINPQKAAVLSVTQVHGGQSWNIIPEEVTLAGCTRYFDHLVGEELHSRMQVICDGLSEQFRLKIELNYRKVYPATINDNKQARHVRSVAKDMSLDVIDQNTTQPSMASEDFAFMLEKIPGSYIWLGNDSNSQQASLHNPRYDFNNEIIPLGASLFVNLAIADRM